VSVEDIEQRLQAKAEEALPRNRGSRVSLAPRSTKIIGKVVRYEKGTTSYGDCTDRGAGVAPERRAGTASLWMFHTVLRERVQEAAVSPSARL
jgi:hypothetical protein